MRVAINLSAHQLRHTELPARIAAALHRHQINPDLLTCEITESVAMEDTAATAKDDPGAAVTARYSRPEWELLRMWAEKVQEYVFRSAPNLHNAFLPEGVEPLDAPPPHVPSPPKKRPGRPRKSVMPEESDVV